jgi:glycolate oxidase FAD binding subunit
MVVTEESIRAALPQIAYAQREGVPVLAPRSADEASAVLRFASEQALPVAISGAATKQRWAGEAEAALIVETAGMAGVREHPWQDLTSTVGAGTRWAEMQRVLAAHGQFVALDPLWPEWATVGGVLAANDSGALRGRYGSARDLVIGMTLVLADGTIARTGGKVVKNVAGYDLHKLMLGAFGTLALITEVTFRLHPLPASRAIWSVSGRNAVGLKELLSGIGASHVNPEGMQLRATAEACTLDVLVGGAEALVQQKLELLDGFCASAGLGGADIARAGGLPGAREALFEEGSAGDGVVVKVTTLPGAMTRVLDAAVQAGAMGAVGYTPGIVFARFAEAAGGDALISLARAAGGAGVFVRGAGAEVAGNEPSALMREVKRQFDPNRILNRGLMGGV